MFEHILVPLDGSTRAENALPIAASIARATGSSVVLLQVISIAMNYGYGSMGYSSGLGMVYGGSMDATPLVSEQVSETEQAEATAYLTRIAHSELSRESLRPQRLSLDNLPPKFSPFWSSKQ